VSDQASGPAGESAAVPTPEPGTETASTSESGRSTGALVDSFGAVLFDLDGVLYRGPETVAGAPEAVAEIRRRGIPVAFVTNNSSRTPEQVATKLAGHGIVAGPEEVVTSAMAATDLLGDAAGRIAFVVGEAGIREALRGAGFELAPDDAERADLVVVGVDSEATYARLRTAALLVQRGARLVATNTDPSYPAPDGLWPGAGALLAAITTTLGRGPDDVAGKPHPPLLRSALARSGGHTPLVVGDRLDTDIDGAAAVGWDSLMALTGVSTERDLLGAPNLPGHLGANLEALFRPRSDIHPAGPGDAEAIERLLTDAGLQTDGVAVRLPETFVAVRGSTRVGTVALELFATAGGTIAHLRSLAVAPDARNERLGVLLTAHAVQRAREHGAATVHAVTETAAAFFERMGFEPSGPRDTLPAPILETPMVRDACAESSVAFRWPPTAPRAEGEAPSG
jgi:HAD superfamily hydrolase (TIGR01450 family)